MSHSEQRSRKDPHPKRRSSSSRDGSCPSDPVHSLVPSPKSSSTAAQLFFYGPRLCSKNALFDKGTPGR